MVHRMVAFLAAIVVIGACRVATADSARCPAKTRISLRRPAVTQSQYPRYRQIDGRSLWDLGMQNGRWPK